MQETWVRSLGQVDPLEEGLATHSSILAWRIPMDRGAWRATVHGITKSQTQLEWLSTAQQHILKVIVGFPVPPKYWVSQKVCSGFSIRWYRKTQMNFFGQRSYFPKLTWMGGFLWLAASFYAVELSRASEPQPRHLLIPCRRPELVCLRAILGSCFWTGWRLRWALWWCLGPSCWERHLWWWSRKKNNLALVSVTLGWSFSFSEQITKFFPSYPSGLCGDKK